MFVAAVRSFSTISDSIGFDCRKARPGSTESRGDPMEGSEAPFDLFSALMAHPELLEIVVASCSGHRMGARSLNSLRLVSHAFKEAANACVTLMSWPTRADSIH